MCVCVLFFSNKVLTPCRFLGYEDCTKPKSIRWLFLGSTTWGCSLFWCKHNFAREIHHTSKTYRSPGRHISFSTLDLLPFTFRSINIVLHYWIVDVIHSLNWLMVFLIIFVNIYGSNSNNLCGVCSFDGLDCQFGLCINL